jgi:hypothetical protein
VPITVDLDLIDVPELTPAVVSVQAQHNAAIVLGEQLVPVVLNRPQSATIPADAVAIDRRFGESITLSHMRAQADGDALDLTLYWRADAPLAENYQVFVHVVGTDGQMVDQRDNQPVGDRYPTTAWRLDTAIADPYTFTNLPEDYTVWVGLYRLSDQSRLVVTPADAQVDGNRLRVFEG